jgi:cold shock CspA family protein
MRVHKYIPERLYGFLEGEAGFQVFFHLGAFQPGSLVEPPTPCDSCPTSGCAWAEMPSPPVLGEWVSAEVDLESSQEAKAPRASKVTRLESPPALQGRVETFDPLRGFGFIKTDGGKSFHLHKSEVLEGRLPLAGQRVSFYGGVRQNKPRACHVKVCP